MEPTYIKDYAHPDIIHPLIELNWLSVTEARKEYFMSDVPRSYYYGNGIGRRRYESNPYSILVQDLQSHMNQEFACEYNVCFLNRYDDQHNQLGWHADDSPEMNPEHPIAVISFGAEREIWVRPNGHKGQIPHEWRQRLGNGSLFVMPAGFQATHQHRIPKSDRACGIRISLTFRNYKEIK